MLHCCCCCYCCVTLISLTSLLLCLFLVVPSLSLAAQLAEQTRTTKCTNTQPTTRNDIYERYRTIDTYIVGPVLSFFFFAACSKKSERGVCARSGESRDRSQQSCRLLSAHSISCGGGGMYDITDLALMMKGRLYKRLRELTPPLPTTLCTLLCGTVHKNYLTRQHTHWYTLGKESVCSLVRPKSWDDAGESREVQGYSKSLHTFLLLVLFGGDLSSLQQHAAASRH